MRCDMVVPVSGMRQACVGHGPFVGSGSVLVPERFRDHCRLIAGRQKWFLRFSGGEKNMKSSLPSICTNCETALM